jgi:hypothetical protein
MKRLVGKLIFGLSLLYCFVSCGLDVFYILEPPVFIRTSVGDDATNRYYIFRTQEVANMVAEYQDIFLGTEIYYKLYNSRTSLQSDIAGISSSNTANSQNGADRMISSSNYQKMMLHNTPQEILIERTGVNREIELRLYREGEKTEKEDDIKPYFRIDGVDMGIPMRYNNKPFDDVDEFNGSDVDSATGDSRDKWYINAYAVSTGMNTELQTFYSQVVHLGEIEVDKKY